MAILCDCHVNFVKKKRKKRVVFVLRARFKKKESINFVQKIHTNTFFIFGLPQMNKI